MTDRTIARPGVEPETPENVWTGQVKPGRSRPGFYGGSAAGVNQNATLWPAWTRVPIERLGFVLVVADGDADGGGV